jgi:hypothetical protein
MSLISLFPSDSKPFEAGERVVQEAHLFEERRLRSKGNLVRRAEREVICLALSDGAHSLLSETLRIIQRKVKVSEFAIELFHNGH